MRRLALEAQACHGMIQTVRNVNFGNAKSSRLRI
jgi:hypothetical protein